MKTRKISVILLLGIAVGVWAVCFLVSPANAVFPFTYQGRLYEDGSPAEGEYDMSFILLNFPDPNGDSEVIVTRGDEILYNVPVSNGYFTVTLDLTPFHTRTEAYMFNGSDRWLYMSVRASELEDPNYYTNLLPMTKITATPYAHTAHRLQTPATLADEITEPILTISNTGTGADLRFNNDSIIQFDNDSIIQYGGSALIDVFNDYQIIIGNSEERSVGADSTVNITQNQTVTIGTDSATIISLDRITGIGGNDQTTIGGTSTTTSGANMQIHSGIDLSLSAGNLIQLQDGVFVSDDPNDLFKVDGAISMQPMDEVPAATIGYGKVFVNNSDGKIYYMDPNGVRYDLAALSGDRVSFSAKRDMSYNWATSSSFETVNFSSGTTIWDNTGSGFKDKNSMFVARADGLYTFHGSIFLTNLGKGDSIAAAINVAGKRYRGDMKIASGEEENVRADITVYLNKDQEVKLEGYVSAATPPVTVYGDASGTEAFTYFNGARVD